MAGPRIDLYFLNLFILFLHTGMFPACWFRQRTYMAQDSVNGVLNETWTHSCLQFFLLLWQWNGCPINQLDVVNIPVGVMVGQSSILGHDNQWETKKPLESLLLTVISHVQIKRKLVTVLKSYKTDKWLGNDL